MRFDYNDGYAALEIETEKYPDGHFLVFGTNKPAEARVRLDVASAKVLVAELQKWIAAHDRTPAILVKISGGLV